jgi:nucleoside-diphosphate-sugar epimerase
MQVLITGATGFIGGHMAEAFVERGWQVVTVARPSSETELLERLGVTIHRGDLADTGLLRRLVPDVNAIVHSAAKVGDWGPVEDYRTVNVEPLRGLLDACKDQPLDRFLHLSSLGVYAARHHYGTTEDEPLPAHHADGYTQSKVEAEQLVIRYYRDFGIPVVVLRPGFAYGPRDRTVMPKLIENLRAGKVRYLGGMGKRALNLIYVKNLVDAAFLALENPHAVGQTYNLTDGEPVSKRRFIETIADAMQVQRPTKSPPLWIARFLTWWMERQARKRGATKAPKLTQARLKFLGLNLDFSIEKAKRELGYRPAVGFERGMQETMEWYRQHKQVGSARRA